MEPVTARSQTITSFAHQRVLVVGAAGGIGRSTAEAFAGAGATVFAAGRRQPEIERVAQDIGGTAVLLDMSDNHAIEAFFAAEPAFDHVVVAAASARTGSVADLSLHDAMAAMDSKFWGTYRIARAAKIAPHGSLTLMSGIYAQRSSAFAVLQGAINAAVEALGRGLALERAPVRVNTVSPGLIDTPVHNHIAKGDRHAMFDQVSRSLPVRRIGQPEDVARAVLFLAANPFATGTVVTVDGGGLLV